MWVMNAEDMQRVERTKVSMICFMCNISVYVWQSGNGLKYKLGLREIGSNVREKIVLVWSCDADGWRQLCKEVSV